MNLANERNEERKPNRSKVDGRLVNRIKQNPISVLPNKYSLEKLVSSDDVLKRCVHRESFYVITMLDDALENFQKLIGNLAYTLQVLFLCSLEELLLNFPFLLKKTIVNFGVYPRKWIELKIFCELQMYSRLTVQRETDTNEEMMLGLHST